MLQATAYIGADTSLGNEVDPASAVVLLPDQDDDGSSDLAAAAAGDSSAAAAAGRVSSRSGTENPVLPVIPFEACLNKFIASEVSTLTVVDDELLL